MTIFADTCYFIALINKNDGLHTIASECTKKYRSRRIVTTDAVLAETLNMMSERGQFFRELTAKYVRSLYNTAAVTVLPATRERFHEAFEFYAKHPDKGYSHTDCMSFCVMRSQNITEAFSHDKHFTQAGFVALLRTPEDD